MIKKIAEERVKIKDEANAIVADRIKYRDMISLRKEKEQAVKNIISLEKIDMNVVIPLNS